MFKFVKTIEEVLSTVSTGVGALATERLGNKDTYGFVIQDDVDEQRVWGIFGPFETEDTEMKQYGLSCLNHSTTPHLNLMYLDYYVEELRGHILHIDMSYGRVAISRGKTLSRSYSDINTVYEQREWDGKSERNTPDTYLITPEMVDAGDVVLYADKRGLFVLAPELSEKQMDRATAILEVYHRIPVVESVLYDQTTVAV